ncbi:hypothetical protein [Bdellovibrio sp. NC01]|uniref:hypothetical protein n=1 Tax=Bdellovibrio sp. NC01 TaxID=2220073 RepID=UPI00115C163A|nr:hypothetical protein [Bdellovibrio sp. NC01]QDK36412.1 hypothetical protein DOE51_01745 [Bdellovibrio sp. NC01]
MIKDEHTSKIDMAKIYGIDLSGYRSKRTAVVRLERNEPSAITITILDDHPFNKFSDNEIIGSQISREIEYLNKISSMNQSTVVIDAPLDLSQLYMKEEQATELKNLWELQMRPIDHVFKALRPTTSFLGAVSQRAQIATAKIFATETYPKGSRTLLGCFDHRPTNPLAALSTFFNERGVSICSNVKDLTIDEYDAIWCAFAGLHIEKCVSTNHESALMNECYRELTADKGYIEWPKGYSLITEWPDAISKIEVQRAS